MSRPTKVELSRVKDIIAQYPAKRAGLIPVLQDIQDSFGYLPEAAIDRLSELSDVSANEIYGVATFYTQFRFSPPGEHSVRVCQGTACHVRQGLQLLNEVEQRLKIKAGQTTADGKFDLERVACLGCCALAPVMVVDDKVHARMSVKKVSSVLSQYTKDGGCE
ncbi:MAG: NADH-quinone oxidoreductase subunit NuoE [Planctomycetota bacterium]|nr:MAG: NADH-quinone oxidoreductase subunit NuoE [Planctomycetota bacterium]